MGVYNAILTTNNTLFISVFLSGLIESKHNQIRDW